MQNSTKLKIAAGGIFCLTIIATITTIFLLPPAAPYIASIGSTLAAAAGKEMIIRLLKRIRDRFRSQPEMQVQPPLPEFEYRQWARLTEEQKKSASGNHLTKIITAEKKNLGQT
jgi:hypothetical protein